MSDLLTINELATRLRISTRTIRRLVAAGLPRIEVTATLHRYDVAAVLAWIDSRKSSPEVLQ